MPLQTSDNGTLVYLPDEDCFGILVSYGAYVSRIQYQSGGIDYDVLLENDDFMPWYEASIPFEEDDED